MTRALKNRIKSKLKTLLSKPGGKASVAALIVAIMGGAGIEMNGYDNTLAQVNTALTILGMIL